MKSDTKNDLLHQLMKCITACETTATAGMVQENVKEMSGCILTCRDCADACGLISRYLARNSSFTNQMIPQVVNIIKRCESECRDSKHEFCQHCAEICHTTHQQLEDFYAKGS